MLAERARAPAIARTPARKRDTAGLGYIAIPGGLTHSNFTRVYTPAGLPLTVLSTLGSWVWGRDYADLRELWIGEVPRIHLLRPSEKGGSRCLRLAGWEVESTRPTCTTRNGRCSNRIYRPRNAAGVRDCTAPARYSTPSSSF